MKETFAKLLRPERARVGGVVLIILGFLILLNPILKINVLGMKQTDNFTENLPIAFAMFIFAGLFFFLGSLMEKWKDKVLSEAQKKEEINSTEN